MSLNRNLSCQAYCNCSLLCHNDLSIISRESIHKYNFGQTLKLQSALEIVNKRSMSSMQVKIWCRKTHLFRRQELRKG